MLTLILKDQGQRQAFAYAYLLESQFSETYEGDWIYLNFGFVKVQLYGRRLEGIYTQICHHHADELHELDEARASGQQGGITKVEIKTD